ncbi:MAG: response regulator [Deltaproteobacteria bacterium]|nr:response regulator [Deltaproteobacteria bacterium]
MIKKAVHNDEIKALRNEVKALEVELAKKDKINQVLMTRVEKSVDSAGDAYSIFENNILLQQEIEERQKVEDALLESEQRLRTILGSIQTGVMIVDAKDHVMVDVNPAASEMIGLPKEEIIGRVCHGFVCPAEKQKCPITDLGQEIDKSEQVLLQVNGKTLPILKTVSSIVLDGRKHLIETFLDISERKRAEKEIEKHRDHLEDLVADRTEELTKANKDLKREIAERREAERALKEAKDEAEAANQAKSQFLAKMSHEIRTPLNGIIGFSEIVIRSDSLERCHEHGRIILEESQHLLGLINEILDHAKIEAGKLKLECRPIDLKHLLETVVSSVHVQAGKKGLQFRTLMEDNVYRYVMGDSLRLRQILSNLACNAIKFTHEGSVTVKVEPVETEGNVSTIRFSVIDTGIGIPLDKQPSVFDSFVQADESTTRKYGGTGLGITIAKQLVTLMGGQMGLESQPGKGSTFWFAVPLEMSECTPEPENETQAAHRGSLPLEQNRHRSGHILVAEDYPVNQRVARQHLEKAGYTVTIVEDGEKAVSACEAHKYNLILMDIQMPNMDGYEATRHIRSRSALCANVPILALTANADLATRNACKKANMDDVLTKPIRRNSLLAVVDRWIALTCQTPDRSGNSFPDENDNTSPKDVMPIDYDVASEEFGDMDILNEVVAQFIEKVETQIQDMREALSEQDIEVLRRNAHAIKGGAATLEAKPLASIAEQIESLCKSNDLKTIPSALDKVLTEFDRLRTYVASCSQP